MLCQNCGTENDDAGRFCIACGHPLAAAPPPAEKEALAGPQPRRARRGWLVGLAGLIVLAAVAVAIYLVVSRAGGGWISYQSQESDGTWSLWLSRPDGQSTTQLVTGAQRLALPAQQSDLWNEVSSPFAPRGNGLVYGAQGADDKWTLYSYTSRTGESQALAQGLDSLDMRFSPKGDRIEWEDEQQAEYSLHIADPDGQNRVDPVQGAESLSWQVSSDRKHLIYVEGSNARESLYVSDLDGANANRLAGPADSIIFALSEKGKIAYAVRDSGVWDVSVSSTDGSDLVQLASRLDDISLWGFSADGRQLLASASQNGSTQLVLLDTGGTGQVTLTQKTDGVAGWYIPGSKQILVYAYQSGQESLYLMDSAGEKQTLLLRGVDNLVDAALMPGGRTLLVVSETNSRYGLDAIDFNTGKRISLSQDADKIDHPKPLGKRQVLFAAENGQQWSLYQVGIAGGEPKGLSGSVDAINGYAASPDGHWIVYSEESLGVIRLFRIDADGGHRQRLADGGIEPVWAP